jgi:glycosyltransferase involved in cell wall biosynthesis
MKVLQLGPWPPPHGGVQTNIVSIREHLRALGHTCGVINITRHRQKEADEVWHPTSAVRTLQLLFQIPSDIIHLHIGGNVPMRVAALALACASIPGRKSVLTFHSGGYPSSPEGQSAAAMSVRGLVFQRYDRIIAVNSEIGDLFRRWGVPADRIRLIEPHALPSGTPTASLPTAMESFWRAHSPVLLTVGLLEPEYDLPAQIQLLGPVLKRHPNAGLIIIGSGSLEQDLRDRIRTVPYSGNILLAGDTPHGSTLRAIHDADALLRTTLYDGDAVSVREGLHMGTPVIATDNGMRPPGLHLVPLGDPEALLRTTLAVLENSKKERKPQAESENMEAVRKLYDELLR